MTYPGGKNGSGVYQKIINQIPPHSVYIELCAGSAAIARMKSPADVTIIIEKDEKQFQDLKDIFDYTDVNVINYDGIIYLRQMLNKQLDHKETFIYADPPYPIFTKRSKNKLYRITWTDDQHVEFLLAVKELKCRIAISSYENELYNSHLKDWRKYHFEAVTRSGKTATECLYMNYRDPYSLHDYRFLGENFTDRQRIKRKAGRWLKNLKDMPVLERKAILSVIQEEFNF